MDQNLKNIHEHMIHLGCGSLMHANFLGHFYDMVNEYWNELAVLQAAHAGEIFMKARLAQEHPLLIFETIPKSTSKHVDSNTGLLNFESLLQDGRTIDYSDLPEKVWAATGLRFTPEQKNLYKQFVYLRNKIQHFASPDEDIKSQITNYIYGFIDPFINSQWGLFAVDFCDDTEPYENLIPTLAYRNVEFLIPPALGADVMRLIDDGTPAYIRRMRQQAVERGYIPR
ncbi:hypothetical protein [Citrobacter freundii]|uniref:hypothetical protein n=1 Tax=Citrobacter freundii TaxID=546 RepID=UPI0019282DC9|nr:hypothetical protein [Citrobacter freundii]CAD5356814.1 conserved protein of unknown function [Citrobacter freundii]